MVHFAWTANISPGLRGKRPVEETLVSLSFLHLVFLPFALPPSPRDLLRLTQFNRVLPRTRVLVRHYSDRGAVYRSRVSRRYFLWLEFHTSRTPSARRAATITLPRPPGRFFNYCILERCCLPAARYFISPTRAPRRCSEVFRYTRLDAVLTVFMHRYFCSCLYNVHFLTLYIYILV